MSIYGLASEQYPDCLRVYDSHPTPSICLETSANSADSGDRTDEVKNAINKIRTILSRYSGWPIRTLDGERRYEQRKACLDDNNHPPWDGEQDTKHRRPFCAIFVGQISAQRRGWPTGRVFSAQSSDIFELKLTKERWDSCANEYKSDGFRIKPPDALKVHWDRWFLAAVN